MRNRLVGGAVLAVAVAVVIAAAAGTAVAHRSSAAIPRCRVRALQVWIGLGEGTGAAGSNFYPLEFSNISHRTCALRGFPGVSAFGLHQIGKPAGRSGGPGAVVTLAPRQTGHALLQIVDVGNFNRRDVQAGEGERAAGLPAERGQVGVHPVRVPGLLRHSGLHAGEVGPPAGGDTRILTQ